MCNRYVLISLPICQFSAFPFYVKPVKCNHYIAMVKCEISLLVLRDIVFFLTMMLFFTHPSAGSCVLDKTLDKTLTPGVRIFLLWCMSRDGDK